MVLEFNSIPAQINGLLTILFTNDSDLSINGEAAYFR